MNFFFSFPTSSTFERLFFKGILMNGLSSIYMLLVISIVQMRKSHRLKLFYSETNPNARCAAFFFLLFASSISTLLLFKWCLFHFHALFYIQLENSRSSSIPTKKIAFSLWLSSTFAFAFLFEFSVESLTSISICWCCECARLECGKREKKKIGLGKSTLYTCTHLFQLRFCGLENQSVIFILIHFNCKFIRCLYNNSKHTNEIQWNTSGPLWKWHRSNLIMRWRYIRYECLTHRSSLLEICTIGEIFIMIIMTMVND